MYDELSCQQFAFNNKIQKERKKCIDQFKDKELLSIVAIKVSVIKTNFW